ncbi:DNA repair protein XRCC1 [Tribolium madens]|uniref:DNA repair protein XRCC1 n=1 Tax=Tribolium madens TaxID=41895 RepID=UPI001CF74F47|nr:DNA repair protein XRCC1 [Tribolium madens]XP_044255440.1 DNA repair protein XRCC1 [Tribolium madens]
MPKIKLDHVVSFSSEDSVHVANNVLNSDPAKKWKCKDTGERSATIVLQFEKASVISAVDIGNENSAYIEVLASRSGTTDDFKVLLVMSSFMTPLEARQGSNPNKVRMFTQDHLSKPECEQKWDRVKIVCTQPFNRHVQYGLSFITFHTPGDKANGTPVQTTIGKFALRPDSPDNLTSGSLFARRQEFQKEPLSAAAAIREASSSPITKPKLKINNTSQSNNNTDNKPVPRNRNEILYSKDEEEPHEKIDKIIEKKQNEKKVKEETTTKKNFSPRPRVSGETSKRKHESAKKESPKKKIKIEKQRKPFAELLRGITLVISGIQNPDRGNLRAMALEMGAKYKPDWDNSCTHLICAFTNTPKFNQVKGKGKIVKRNWIEECHSQRKRLPWRRFCLDKNDAKQPESEDEIWEEVEQKIEDDSTDDEGFDDTKMQKRIKEIQAKQKEKSREKENNLFSQDTDEEKIESKQDDEMIKKLPGFLDFKTFFIDECLDKDVVKTLERYIIAYNGIVAENPSEDVDYFITSENNAKNLKSYNSRAICLRPDWLWDCHNNQKLVSTVDYVL